MRDPDPVTDQIAEFTEQERRQLQAILAAWNDLGLPPGFSPDGVVPVANRRSGLVFLTNRQRQVAMLNGSALEEYFCCPCGHHGFRDAMAHPRTDACWDTA